MVQQSQTNLNLSGQGPSILLAQDRSVAQKPHWGFRCFANANFFLRNRWSKCPQTGHGLGAILVVERDQHPVIVQEMAFTKISISAFRCFFREISSFLNFISQNRMKSSLKLGFFNFSSAILQSVHLSGFPALPDALSLSGCTNRPRLPSSDCPAFVDLSQLLFQQRDRCVLLILDIHNQLNDLVDHRIVLNQLHRLPDDQLFQPFFLHGLFVASLTLLDVGAYLYFFSKCFTILRILARAVSFFCRSITLALLNFCVSSHLHCAFD